MTDPFSVLGVPARTDLTDDEVRAAWRRVATATHPDRADGGDPARFAEAAAAYTLLRTRFGRSEALADQVAPPGRRGLPARLWPRLRRGRPLVLALRVAVAIAAGTAVAVVAGARPATPALITGLLTWLLLTARHDLAPPS
ncbi:MAG: J domain-containing protein [Actinobacteria bacterium]|nr:J domain-containing protein [Actinomycetota bacterium]